MYAAGPLPALLSCRDEWLFEEGQGGKSPAFLLGLIIKAVGIAPTKYVFCECHPGGQNGRDAAVLLDRGGTLC